LARDHFLQTAWRSFFRVFTLGLILVLSPAQAGKVAVYLAMFLNALSLFYHSAIRVRLAWLDRVFVTPQMHRIHHSVDPQHYNKNFADALPIFEILFGTYHRPSPAEFPATGLGPTFLAPRSVWSAQFGPVWAAARMLWSRPPRTTHGAASGQERG
jgi:sterol desaturase/sphingolipid hydroxylase (fatty acid hydroxylase superfamily)